MFLQQVKRGIISGIFANATQKISEAIKATAQQEINSIKRLSDSLINTVQDVAVATIDYTQAGINYWTIPAKVLNNILTKNETTTYTDAVKDPVKTYINSVGKAFNSTKDVYQSFRDSTKKAAQASFDVAFAFPKFGLNLMGEKGDEVKKSLQESYDEYHNVLTKAADTYKSLAKKFATTGLGMFEKFANATVVPKLTKVLESVTNGTLSKKFEELGNRTILTRNYALKVARNLTQGGIFFNKAAFDLEALLQKYSMNLITEEDARDYAKIINEHIETTKESVKKAEESLTVAFNGVVHLFQTADVHRVELMEALEYVKKNIKEKDPVALEMSKNITIAAFKSTVRELRELGVVIGRAGKEVIDAGVTIGLVIPKFGLSILKKQASVLGLTFMEVINKIENAVLAVVQKFTSAGKQIENEGRIVEESVSQPQKPDESRSDFEKIQAELEEMMGQLVLNSKPGAY